MKVGDKVKLKDTREDVVILETGDCIKHQFVDRPCDQGIRLSVSDYVKDFKRKEHG